MKNYMIYKLIGLAFLAIALLTGCEYEDDLKGNGNVTNQRRMVQTFDAIDISGVLNIYIEQSDAFSVQVVTDENLQELVTVETLGSKLYISSDESEDYEATKMDVYISFPDINSISLDGVTAMFCADTLMLTSVDIDKANTGYMEFRSFLDNLSVTSYDVGELELHGKANNVTINNQMIGDISAYGMNIKKLNLTHDGTGEVEVYVSDSLIVEITGVGNVYCKGNPGFIDKLVTGVGKLFIEN